jgi:Carboxypeptidase regulatory-like domain
MRSGAPQIRRRNCEHKRYRGGNVFIGLITFLLTAITALAQSTDSITGTITDDTGAVVPQIAVTVTNIGTGQKRNVVKDSRGQYSALSLQIVARRTFRVCVRYVRQCQKGGREYDFSILA